jgi:hypothetical protein
VVSDEVRGLLDRFAADIGRVVPLVALWAHGFLALGDFQPGCSDLDLVALVGVTITDTQRQELKLAHEKLIEQVPLADTLHCSYVVESELADAGRRHVTWAHEELFERVVSPVTRQPPGPTCGCVTSGWTWVC